MPAAVAAAAAAGVDEVVEPAAGVVALLAAGDDVPGNGGMAGTAGVVSAVRATDEDSLLAAVAEALGPGGAALASVPGDHAGASSDAAGLLVVGVADGAAVVAAADAENAGASLVAGSTAGAEPDAAMSPPAPPISGDSSVHSPKPGGMAGSVSLIFMYKNTPTAANSVIVANGRRELTASPPDKRMRIA